MRKPRRRGGLSGAQSDAADTGTAGRGASQPRSLSPYRLKVSPTRETLTYAQAQNIVEVDLDGRLHRISIFDPLLVITEDEMTAQDIAECNSNKENSEQSSVTTAVSSPRRTAAYRGKKKEVKQLSSSSSQNHCSNSHGQSQMHSSVNSHHGTLPKPILENKSLMNQTRRLLALRRTTVTLRSPVKRWKWMRSMTWMRRTWPGWSC